MDILYIKCFNFVFQCYQLNYFPIIVNTESTVSNILLSANESGKRGRKGRKEGRKKRL